MQAIEKRIAALEQASPPADGMVIMRRFVSPGRLDAEIHRLTDDDGKCWDRQPGESEQGLIDRASREVKRNEWGFAGLSTWGHDEY